MAGKLNSEVVVLIPTFNEAEGLAPTVLEVKRFLGDPYILVIDAKSTDGTVQIARSLGLDVVFQEGFGKGDAIAKAIKVLRECVDPEYVVLIDADYTYPAHYIPQMIKILKENPGVGMVCGNRFEKPFSLANVRSAYYIGNRLLAMTHRLVNGVKLTDPLTGLRVVRWEIIRDWQPKSKSFDIEAELNYLVERKGYKIKEIPIHYRKRLGEKKLKLRHGFTILRRILAEAIS